jgi:hypothetical protein
MRQTNVAISVCVSAVVSILGGCKSDQLEIKEGSEFDYHRKDLNDAVAKFVADGRSIKAFADLAATISKLRPQMDAAVAAEAELKLVASAWQPLQSLANSTVDEQARDLATTVWAIALRSRIRHDTLTSRGNPTDDKLLALTSETGAAYLQRICSDALKVECYDVVPEFQPQVVRQLAVHAFTDRLRSALADCLVCNASSWQQSVQLWQELDAKYTAGSRSTTLQAQPQNWPVAGAGSGPFVPADQSIVLEITSVGDVVIDGRRISTIDRAKQLSQAVSRPAPAVPFPLLVHALPTVRVAQLRDITKDASLAGINRVGVIARRASYPWERRVYWLTVGTGIRVPIRATDTVQALVRALDDADRNTARLD